jgi:hypothetical protein
MRNLYEARHLLNQMQSTTSAEKKDALHKEILLHLGQEKRELELARSNAMKGIEEIDWSLQQQGYATSGIVIGDPRRLLVQVHGGLVTSVYTDAIDSGLEVVVMDYDTEGLEDSEITEITYINGAKPVGAYVAGMELEECNIDLDKLFAEMGNPAENAVSIPESLKRKKSDDDNSFSP